LLVDRCFVGVAQACNQITFGPGQSLVQIRNVNINLDELVTKGEDFEVSYRKTVGAGSLAVRLLASHIEESTTRTLGIAIDRTGQTGSLLSTGLPDWLLTSYLTYSWQPWSVTLQGRYISSGVIDATRFDPSDAGYATTALNSTNDNHVASAFYANLFATVD